MQCTPPVVQQVLFGNLWVPTGACAAQATQEVVSRMPLATNSEFEEAVKAAKDAFPAWKRTPVPHRQRVMLKLQQLIRENMVII